MKSETPVVALMADGFLKAPTAGGGKEDQGVRAVAKREVRSSGGRTSDYDVTVWAWRLGSV
jgi:hypothetical protein